MGLRAKELSAIEIKAMTDPGLHFVGGVAGLALQVMPSGARSWILRIKFGGKRRSMGLGGFPSVTLADARRRAREEREKADKGQDPIGDRRAEKARLIADQKLQFTFRQAADSYVAKHEKVWKNGKHSSQWHATLATYCYPIIGSMRVRDVTTAHVLSCIEPIWISTNTTATRLRGRIESVLDFATARGWRAGENPARWRGHLAHTLAKPSMVSKVIHHAALSVGEIGAFMVKLRAVDGMSALALQFLTLTATRSNETRGALWKELDFDTATWTVPALRTKANKEHRVPLSGQALAIVAALRVASKANGVDGDDDLVFRSPRGGQLSDMAMTLTCRRIGADLVPHGMRSTFRDWCSERTNTPSEVAEAALAHAIESKVEAAYRRGDLLDKRRPLMQSWAAFIAKPEVKGAVVNIHSAQQSA